MQKRKDLSLEEFYSHWRNVHGELFRSLEITKKNILLYQQATPNQRMNDTFATATGMVTLGQWDGMAIFEAESWPKLLETFADPEFVRLVEPDTAKFVDEATIQFLAVDFRTVAGS